MFAKVFNKKRILGKSRNIFYLYICHAGHKDHESLQIFNHASHATYGRHVGSDIEASFVRLTSFKAYASYTMYSFILVYI